MVDTLIFVAAMALIVQVFIGLTFFVSCIWEKERRATVFAGLQFLGMFGVLILYLYLTWIGFFETDLGFVFLIAWLIFGAVAAFILMRNEAPNPRALQGAKGLIVANVKRYDEREIVSVRNRLRPGSGQYKEFYKEHPEYEGYDTKRRKMGGASGQHPGAIDRPYERPNMAATLACWFLPIYLSAPDKFKPQPHPEFREKKINLSPEEATERVKGYTQSLGAVTTDLPLMPDKPLDIGVEHFCRVCKKCAVCCPSNSIPVEKD